MAVSVDLVSISGGLVGACRCFQAAREQAGRDAVAVSEQSHRFGKRPVLGLARGLRKAKNSSSPSPFNASMQTEVMHRESILKPPCNS